MINIGKLQIKVPVMQGGMGVGVSLSGLAGAVAKAGGVGVLSAAQIGFKDSEYEKAPLQTNLRCLKEEIRKAKEIAEGGVVGVNIMVVTDHYEDYVRSAVEAGADLIVSGAGLPMDLPELVKDSETAIAPIVSGLRAMKVIISYWEKHYDRIPDAIVIEGPRAGGHLGFKREQIESLTVADYDAEIREMIAYAAKQNIPVFVAGGVYERADLLKYREMGAAGVQLATRFVTTYECDADPAYKQAYIDAAEEDIQIVESPVGMPGRAIRNEFLKRVENGERILGPCRKCITTCNPATTKYCISKALINAVEGRCEEGLLFCGSNACRAEKLEHVSDIMEEFIL